MAVVERHWLRGQLVHRRPSVTVRDCAALVVLEQIRALELKHLLDTLLRDRLADLAQACRGALRKTEFELDQILGVLFEKLEALRVLNRRDLDELRDPVTYVRL